MKNIMTLVEQIAKNFRDVHFGGNWTASNLKDQVADVTWEEANTKVYSFNTIGLLVFHINYYVEAMLKVLQGSPLHANDKFSFDMPAINNAEDWENLVSKALTQAQNAADLIAALPESTLFEPFVSERYGNYYRNILGTIEHSHYHLGQIALIKKIVKQSAQGSH